VLCMTLEIARGRPLHPLNANETTGNKADNNNRKTTTTAKDKLLSLLTSPTCVLCLCRSLAESRPD
jgi:hypothetical protein